ncbi:hypothetical protein WJX77_002264 [Trebouxia sp. C0004]
MSQSESVPMTPVTAADGMLRGHGDEDVLLQHHTSKFEDLKSEAEAQTRRGAYQDAIISYTTMQQGLGTLSNAEKAHIHGCLASCLMQTGQLKVAAEECSGAVACAQGLADVSMLESALRQRAIVYEQLEAYDLSLQDFCCILQLQPGSARQVPTKNACQDAAILDVMLCLGQRLSPRNSRLQFVSRTLNPENFVELWKCTDLHSLVKCLSTASLFG